VEATWLGKHPLAAAEYRASVQGYLEARLGATRFEVEGEEQGAIPMTPERLAARSSPRVYHIGLAGGMAKPSTGYAFLAIQRFSRALARRLLAEDLPAPPPIRTARARFLDGVFLSYLERHAAQAPELFLRLFDRVDPEVLVRFLSDAGRLSDTLRVMAALPTLSFAAEAVRFLGG
jgi:lycopene beta-cyclase